MLAIGDLIERWLMLKWLQIEYDGIRRRCRQRAHGIIPRRRQPSFLRAFAPSREPKSTVLFPLRAVVGGEAGGGLLPMEPLRGGDWDHFAFCFTLCGELVVGGRVAVGV